MKKLITLASLALAFCLTAQSVSANIPIDTTGGKYWNNLYSVNITSGVTFGSNVDYQGNTKTLKMDIYQPVGDTVSERPVIVFAHGGSFITGTRTDSDVVDLCDSFAAMGYVTASIDYRLGMYPFDSTHAEQAVVRAVQDMKAAVRFFRKSYLSGGNPYHIQPNYVFAGGSSAGAFMALHLAYLDSMSKVPTYIGINSLGGLEGNSGNPGYSSHVNAVINLCGALGDSTWLSHGEEPVVGMQGDSDHTVPYGSATIVVVGNPIMRADGGHSIHLRAMHVGVHDAFYTWKGADHVPYAGANPTEMAYMDTTVNFVKAFIRPLLVQPSVSSTNDLVTPDFYMHVYPNPSQGMIHLKINQKGVVDYKGELYDLQGNLVKRFNIDQANYLLRIDGLDAGVYFLRLSDKNGNSYTDKLILSK